MLPLRLRGLRPRPGLTPGPGKPCDNLSLMTTDFDDDGEGYVKGEKELPIDWNAVSVLEAKFLSTLSEQDDDLRLEQAKSLVMEMES